MSRSEREKNVSFYFRMLIMTFKNEEGKFDGNFCKFAKKIKNKFYFLGQETF